MGYSGRELADRLQLLRLEQEIRNRIGMLVVAKGQEVTRALIVKLNNFAEAGLIDGEFVVMVPL